MITNDFEKAAVEILRRFEGSCGWPYLCTAGRVTTGIGHMMPTPEAACVLPWQRFIDQEMVGPASSDDIVEAFETISNAPKGEAAVFYSPLTQIRLKAPEIDAITVDRLRSEFCPALRDLYPGFDAFPLSARLCLVDLAWNLGAAGLSKFTHLRAAVLAGDWAKAAKCCSVKTSRAERNRWRQRQFEKAAEVAS